jgi:hypothetical protein
MSVSELEMTRTLVEQGDDVYPFVRFLGWKRFADGGLRAEITRRFETNISASSLNRSGCALPGHPIGERAADCRCGRRRTSRRRSEARGATS